ncbi:hypothetical protein K7432_011968 [Basidiobolus ranarum]|uniref:Uncharacterized protein n=1 Tax=Basidiobolus ranarum TaxID=34480 RepID=A0ABR2VT19_9FUNG
MALHRFHSSQSSYLLPSDEHVILAIFNQQNLSPLSIRNCPHGRGRLLAWIKITYELEHAVVRNKILGNRSVRKNRKPNGKIKSSSITLRWFLSNSSNYKENYFATKSCPST